MPPARQVPFERINAVIPAVLKEKAFQEAQSRGLNFTTWLIILLERETASPQRFSTETEKLKAAS